MLDENLIPLTSVALGALSTGVKALRLLPATAGYEIVAATLTPATVAPTSAAALIDVNIDGTSIFSTRLTYADGATAVTGGVIDTTKNVAGPGTTVTIDVDQVGSGTAGTGGTVTVWARKR
jgi:hypothetical protein